jgi:hypothetical protein
MQEEQQPQSGPPPVHTQRRNMWLKKKYKGTGVVQGYIDAGVLLWCSVEE